jgi:Gpi18-like mannosyltransferase
MTKNKKPVKRKALKDFEADRKPIAINILFIALLGIIIVRGLMCFLPSHKIDIGVLKWELSYLANNPLENFTTDVHFVYGPLYAFLLYISGNIVEFFSIPEMGQVLLIKIWSVIFDIIAAYFIYLIGKKYNKDRMGLILGILYVFNPAVFFNSSVWGQFDGVTAALLIAVVYFFNIKKSNVAVFIYAVAALTKPQSIALLPLVAILYFKDFPWNSIYRYFKTKEKGLLKEALVKSFSKLAVAVLGCILIYTVMVFPVHRETPFYVIKEMEVYGHDGQNMSLNKNINVSSTEEYRKYAPNHVTDGRNDTQWSSGHSDPQWLYVDLGAPEDIASVRLNWGYEYAKKYNIQVSDDADNWKTVKEVTDGKGKSENIELTPVKARYVKVELVKRPFPYGLITMDSEAGFVKKTAYAAIDYYYWLLHHYQTNLDDYPYATANAFNLWTILGKQTTLDNQPYVFGISYYVWGYILLFGVVWVMASFLLLLKRKSVKVLYYTGYFLTFGMFFFPSRVHERYLLTSIIFALVCVFWDKRMLIPYILLSATCLANQWYVYAIQNETPDLPWISPEDPFSHLVAWVTFLVMLLSIGYLLWLIKKKDSPNPAPPVRAKGGRRKRSRA